jgi:hypothetical protein
MSEAVLVAPIVEAIVEATVGQQSTQVLTRESVDEIFNEFTKSSEDETYKVLIEKFKGCDKSIQGFNEFMQSKAYKKKFPDATDYDRYVGMIQKCLSSIAESGVLDKYLINSQQFFIALDTFLQSDDVYETLSEPFGKGSFKTVGEKFARIIKPKEDDDSYTGFGEVSKWIKQYSLKFVDQFSAEFSKPNRYLYMMDVDVTGLTDPEERVKSIVYALYDENILFFATAKGLDDETNTSITLLLSTSHDMSEKYSVNSLDLASFVALLESNEYKPVYIDNYISMPTLKRLFIAKDRDTSQQIKQLLSVIKKRHGLHTYEAKYIDTSGYNHLTEDNFPNILKGIVSSGAEYVDKLPKNHYHAKDKDHPHGVLATFQLNGSAGNLEIMSYWVTVEPVEICVPDFDREPFEWKEISVDEYFANMKVQGTLATEYLYTKS